MATDRFHPAYRPPTPDLDAARYVQTCEDAVRALIADGVEQGPEFDRAMEAWQEARRDQGALSRDLVDVERAWNRSKGRKTREPGLRMGVGSVLSDADRRGSGAKGRRGRQGGTSGVAMQRERAK